MYSNISYSHVLKENSIDNKQHQIMLAVCIDVAKSMGQNLKDISWFGRHHLWKNYTVIVDATEWKIK